LLRGACHRARVRATRWLAMTVEELRRPQRKHNPGSGLRQINPTGKSLLIFRSSSQARESKIFRFTRRANHHYKLAPSHPMRGAARDRHERAVGCGGREACERRAQAVRTAKPCGPGAPTLASSSQEAKFSRAMVARKPGHQGERGVSRKPPRREGRIASAEPVCSCAFFVCLGTRDRGCSAHPVFPAPSWFLGRRSTHSPGASRRGNAVACPRAV